VISLQRARICDAAETPLTVIASGVLSDASHIAAMTDLVTANEVNSFMLTIDENEPAITIRLLEHARQLV
jgi:hypothetical protein